MRSLILRVPVLAMLVLAVSLVVAIIIAYELLVVEGRQDLDGVLQRERNRFEQSIELIATDLARLRARDVIDEGTFRAAVRKYLELNPSNSTYLKLVRMGDELLSSQGGPEALIELRESGRLPLTSRGVIETVDTPQGPMRSLSADVSIGEDWVATFQVAALLDPIAEESRAALARLALAAFVSLVLGGALLTVVLRRTLEPLRGLASTVHSITYDDLSVRMPRSDRQDEVAVLADEFNGMLGRLEEAAEGRKKFLAMASHELRTPITIARGHLEAMEAAPENSEISRRAGSIARAELRHLSRIVEDLTALARSDAEDFVIARELDLTALIEDLELRLQGLELGEVIVEEAPSCAVRADGGRLAQMLLNLVENARIHNPPGTRIEVQTHLDNGGLALFVRDDGDGIDPSIVGRVFEPFVKGEKSEFGPSSGLGLAVVRAVVDAHRWSLELDTSAQGTTIAVRIPSEDVGPASHRASKGSWALLASGFRGGRGSRP